MSDTLIKIDDVSNILGISVSTVKGYSQSIEVKGYKFLRGIKNEYLFTEKDVDLFRTIIRFKKEMPLDEAMVEALKEVMDIPDLPDKSDGKADISVVKSDITKALSDMAVKLDETMSQNKVLSNEIEALKVQGLREGLENRKLFIEFKEELLSAIKEQAASKEIKKKKWWKFWE